MTSANIREAAQRYLTAITQDNVLPGHTFETCADLDFHQIALDLQPLLTAIGGQVRTITGHLDRHGGMPETRRANIIRRQVEAFEANLTAATDGLTVIARNMPSGEERHRAELAAERKAETG